jgi:isoquinoline 1-oxidoreductase beta subunit
MLTRRVFLRAFSAAAGGMLMSLYIDVPTRAQAPAPPTYSPEAFVDLRPARRQLDLRAAKVVEAAQRPDGTIVIQVNRLEFGQGVQTALPMILADELDADWSQVVGELAPAADVYKDPIYQLQMTGGSISVPHSFQQYRELGAKMRAMLVATAAERWRVVPTQCRTENSVVYGPANQSARYVDLASEAARRPVPGEVRLKTPSEFRLIGTPVRRLDSRAKCDGSLRFGMDVDLPGLKVALVARPPVYGGRVKGLNDREARAVAGVRDVFEVPTIRGGTGVAVVADTFWMAKQARDRLQVEWDVSGLEHPDTSQMLTRYVQLSQTTGNVA